MPSKEQIAQYLSTIPQYGEGFGGNNFFNQYRNAQAQLNALPLMEGYDADNQNIQLQEAALKGQKGSAIAGGVISGLTGAATLAAGAEQASHINDTSAYEGQLDDLSRAGNYNYNNFAQLANDYAQTDFMPQYDYSQTRGMNGWQKAGSIGSGTLTGAMTGMQIGGPWGALIGGALGAGASAWGVISGDKAAEAKNMYLQNKALQSQEIAQANFGAANERISNDKLRNGVVNMVAQGGSISRPSLKEYADRILRQPIRYNEPAAPKIVRSKGEGGTVVRIRVK